MTTMPLPGSPSDPESLLAEHGEFLTSLARALVRDTGAADDLAQETLVEALNHGGQPDRPWLATVLRRKAANRFRSERRRSDREQRAARTETGGDSADSAEQMEVVERLFRLVRELEETQREAVIGRFYRGLSFAELSSELGAPASTVQSRVKRGLETLRKRLDDIGGQGRSAWVGALGAFAGLDSPAKAGAAAASGGAAIGTTAAHAGARSWWAASSLARSAAAIAAVGAAGLLGHAAWTALTDPSEDGDTAAPDLAALEGVPSIGPRESRAQNVAGLASPSGASDASAVQAVTSVSGRDAVAAEVSADADGFVLQIDEGGHQVPAGGLEVHWFCEQDVDDSQGDLTSGNAAGAPSSGFFFDDGDSGSVSSGTLVETTDRLGAIGYGGLGYGGGGDVKVTKGTVTTDQRGGFQLSPFQEGSKYTLEVKTDDTYRAVRLTGIANDWKEAGERLRLLRVPHGYLEGRAVDLDGRALKGVTVSAGRRESDTEASSITDDEGRFQFALRARGARIKASLTGHVQVGERKAEALEDGGWEPMEVTLARAGTLEIDLGPARAGDLPREVIVMESRDQSHVYGTRSQMKEHRGKAAADGLVTIAGLPVGRRLVVATGAMGRIHPYRRGSEAVSVPYGYGGMGPKGAEPIVIPESGSLRLSLPDVRHHTLRGRVETAEGEGAAGVVLNATAAYAGGGPLGSRVGRAVADEDGRFSMGLVSHGEAGPVLIHTGYGEREQRAAAAIDLAAPLPKDFTLKLAPQAVLSGRLEAPSPGSSMARAGLRLVLLESHGSSAGDSVGEPALPRPLYETRVSGKKIQASGDFAVDLPVPEGRYRLIATHPDYVSVEQEFDFPLNGAAPVLRFTNPVDAEVTVRLVAEPGTSLETEVVAYQVLPSGTASLPLAAAYQAPGGALIHGGLVAPSSELQSRLPNITEDLKAVFVTGSKRVTLRVPSGPLWIGALGRFEGHERAGVAATGAVLVPKGASEVTLTLSPPLSVRGRLSPQLLAKGPGPYLQVRAAGASTDLDLGRGPLSDASPFVRVDRQGRFDFDVPAGTYECRVYSSAGALLKTVSIDLPQPEGELLLVE